MVQPSPNSPYKFLNPYTLDDQDIFFGREPETQILLADVVVQRLVVLFAGTGTGKTSLINAAVRPRLHERGYQTFVLRVRIDPDNPRRIELRSEETLPHLEGDTLLTQLRGLAAAVRKPLVLFFDQFEEFFLYILKRESTTESEPGGQFIADVAELYQDKDSGINFVFSMREDYFVEMDAFRDEIPNVFHNDSNLRLRWFDGNQAHDAIVRPALARGFDVKIEEDLAQRLITDLTSPEGTIEPARLQIVCDTLWRDWSHQQTIALREYKSYAKEGRDETIATQIADRRLEEEFAKLETKEELDLLAALLPYLRSERNTKRPRSLEELVDKLNAVNPSALDDERLRQLLDKLEQSQLIRINRLGPMVIELSHDYLAGRVEYFRDRILAIWPFRALQQTMAAFQEKQEPATLEQLRTISEAMNAKVFDQAHIALGDDQVEVLFRSALAQGEYMRPWFDLEKKRRETTAWQIVDETLEKGSFELARNVVILLSELQDPRASKSLERTWKQKDLANLAIDQLSRVETPAAVGFLSRSLSQEQLVSETLDALIRLNRSRRRDVATLAADAATDFLAQRLAQEQLDKDSISMLGRLETVRSIELLVKAAAKTEFAPPVRDALTNLARSRDRQVAESAQSALKTPGMLGPQQPTPKRGRATVSKEPSVPAVESSIGPGWTTRSSSREPPFGVIASQLQKGLVIPFLGAGASVSGRPPGAQWDPRSPSFLPSGGELAKWLAAEVNFPEPEDSYDLTRVASYFEMVAGRVPLREDLHRVFAGDYPPTETHRFLAALNVPLLIVTNNYDDLIERAFLEQMRPYHLVVYPADRRDLGEAILWSKPGAVEPEAHSPQRMPLSLTDTTIIYKMQGSIDRQENKRDSFVITDDDYVDFLARMIGQTAIPARFMLEFRKRRFLFLGYGLRDWYTRVLLRNLQTNLSKGDTVTTGGWAIQYQPSPTEVRFWLHRGVEIFNMGMDEFVAQLQARMAP